jgi:hypothetical protein
LLGSSQEREGFQLYAAIKLPQMKAKVLEFNGLLTEQKVGANSPEIAASLSQPKFVF